MKRIIPLVGLFFLWSSQCLFAQHKLQEDWFNYTTYPDQLILELNAPNAQWKQVSIRDCFSNETLSYELLTDHTLQVKGLHPAQLIAVFADVAEGKNTVHKEARLSTLSASTGAMNVYFNHPVSLEWAQLQSAVNLSNTLDDKLITYINACQQTLDIAIYSSYSPSATTGIAGAINAAYNRGVQVRIVYDGSASTLMSLLNTNIPTLPSPQTSMYTIMHNKFVIFDARHTDASVPYVWTGSTNWTTAQIEGPDKNNVIAIQDQALALGYTLEFEEMWGGSGITPNLTTSKFGPYKTDNTPHQYVIGGKIVNSYFSPSDGTNAKIKAAINTANSDISIAVMNFTRSDLSAAVIAKYNAGVTNVNLLIDSQNPTSNQTATFQAALPATQVEVFNLSGIMHHKFMVVDNFNANSDPQVLLGSHNWSTSAETKNDENTLIVHDLNIANQYFQAFAYLFQLSGGQLAVPTVKNNTDIRCFPNPTTDRTTLAVPEHEGLVTIQLQNILGQILWQTKTTDTTIDIDLSAYNSGMYALVIQSDSGSYVTKIVKK
jgi:phosphatidylserine/phosphatidylglycerophosphate/cardiolipin synthase-like enzyme